MSVVLQNVGRSYGSQWALREVSTTIERGESVGILGANGAGKSTLLRLLAGWQPTTEGSIMIANRKLRPETVKVRQQLMLLDDPIVNDLPATDAIGWAVNDYDVDRPKIEAEVADWMHQLDLVGSYRKSMRALSKGQRFKFMMVCLFVVRPYVWLLDEPFSAGLDAGGMQLLEEQMAAHAADGGVVIFSSQWPQHARRLADRAVVLHQGSVVCDHRIGTGMEPRLLPGTDPALAAVLGGLADHE